LSLLPAFGRVVVQHVADIVALVGDHELVAAGRPVVVVPCGNPAKN